jgi:hypothetical protein
MPTINLTRIQVAVHSRGRCHRRMAGRPGIIDDAWDTARAPLQTTAPSKPFPTGR